MDKIYEHTYFFILTIHNFNILYYIMINTLKTKAKEAIKHSYSPYSQYRVSAAIETENGNIYTGTNIENSSYSMTMCAERVAIFKAISNGNKKIVKILIYSDNKEMPYPCGACLQVMSEFCEKDAIIIVSNNKSDETYSLDKLLPKKFQL